MGKTYKLELDEDTYDIVLNALYLCAGEFDEVFGHTRDELIEKYGNTESSKAYGKGDY